MHENLNDILRGSDLDSPFVFVKGLRQSVDGTVGGGFGLFGGHLILKHSQLGGEVGQFQPQLIQPAPTICNLWLMLCPQVIGLIFQPCSCQLTLFDFPPGQFNVLRLSRLSDRDGVKCKCQLAKITLLHCFEPWICFLPVLNARTLGCIQNQCIQTIGHTDSLHFDSLNAYTGNDFWYFKAFCADIQA